MDDAPTSPDGGVAARIEQWFVRRGVPHFIEGYEARTDIWTRAVPILVVAYLLGGLNALDLANWSVTRNILTALLVVVVLLATWAVTNAVRHRPLLSRPTEVGRPELVVFVIGPALPIVAFGQWGDVVQVLIEGVAVLAVIYVVTSYGVIPLLRWAGQRARAQLRPLANLVIRALPLLLLFTMFLFINPDVWQVAGALTGLPYALTLGIFFVLGALFVLSRIPQEMRGLSTFAAWDDVRTHVPGTPATAIALPVIGEPPAAELTGRQKVNIGLVSLFSQALQVTLVVVVVLVFFVVFGFLTIPEATASEWVRQEADVWLTVTLQGRQLVVTEPLVRVAAFLAAFTGMYFTVVLATDATYREEFAEDVGPEVRQALAVRCAYRWSLGVGNQRAGEGAA